MKRRVKEMARMRAISPVVAVLLLILVAVGAAVLIYLWLTGFAGKATQTPASLQTQFRIETARLYNISTKDVVIEVYARNTGRTSIDLGVVEEQNAIALYIYDSFTGDLIYSNTSVAKISKAVKDGNDNDVWEPNELLLVNITVNGGLDKYFECGHYYDIKLVVAGQEDTIPSVRMRCITTTS